MAPKMSAQTPLELWLRSLKASGSSGFEGLTRDVLSEVAGTPFEIAKSGPQGGVDGANCFGISFEAKRYAPATPLPLDQLTAKVGDAVRTYPDLDLWVLVASREIPLGDAEQLRRYGEDQGIGVLILDRKGGPAGLDGMGILLASAPRTEAAWLKRRPGVRAELAALRSHAGFADAAFKLREALSAADVGWENARRTLSAWMREGLADQERSRHRFHTYGEVLANDVRFIARPGLDGFLDGAIAYPGTVRAVLGDEGMGKTWGVLRWWTERSGPDGSGLPLTVVLPAANVHGSDLEALIAAALHKRTDLRTSAFWVRRLARWRKGGAVRLLVIIDGLNQVRSKVSWGELLRSMRSEGWGERASVILTARADDWNRLNRLADLASLPLTFEVGRFEPDELDELLKPMKLTRGDFDPRLFELMRTPRLVAIALAHRGDAARLADLTPEALAFQEFRHRIHLHGSALPLDEEGFRDLVVRLGRRFAVTRAGSEATPLTRRDLLDEIGVESGPSDDLDTMIREMTGGQWLRPITRDRFVLQPTTVPLALGLTLVDALERDGRSPDAVLPEFLDAFRGSDLSVAILRSATAVAMHDEGVTGAVRSTLLSEWINSQNFRSADFQTLWRSAVVRPEPLLELAEKAWMSLGGEHAFDEVVTKALAQAASSGRPSAPAVLHQVTWWVSAWWPDYLEGMFPGGAVEIKGGDDRRARTLERMRVWETEVAPRLAAPPNLRRVASADGRIRLMRRAFVIASYLRRTDLLEAFRAWAAASAILGDAHLHEVVEWVLRANREDGEEAERAIIDAAREFHATTNSIGSAAARHLLEALATPEASRVHDELALAEAAAARSDGLPPRRVGLLTVDMLARVWPEGSDPDQDDLSAIASFDPEVVKDGAWLAGDRTTAPLILAGLARWAPQLVGPALLSVRTAAASLLRSDLARLGRQAVALPLVFGKEERSALLSAWKEAPPDAESHNERFPHLLLRSIEASRDEQMSLLRDAGEDLPGGDFVELFERLPLVECEAHLRNLRDAGAMGPVRAWLGLMGSLHADAAPKDGSILFDLARHDDAEIRTAAIRALLGSGDVSTAANFVGLGWRWAEGMPRNEAAHGSLLILKAKPILGEVILDLADPRVSARAYEEDDAELPRFARFVESRIEQLVPRSAGWTTEFEWGDLRPALLKLVARMPDETEEWLGRFQAEQGLHNAMSPLSPFLGLLHGLFIHRAERASSIWQSAMKALVGGSSRYLALERLPFDVPYSDVVADLREEALSLVLDDEGLSAIAWRVGARPDDTWLLKVIWRDLQSHIAADVGRALTLAGFARPSTATVQFWAARQDGRLASGWIAEVEANAARNFALQRSMIDIAFTFAQTADDVEARDAYLRLQGCQTPVRYDPFVRAVNSEEVVLSQPRRTQWILGTTERHSKRERTDRARRDIYCGTKIVRDMAPWL